MKQRVCFKALAGWGIRIISFGILVLLVACGKQTPAAPTPTGDEPTSVVSQILSDTSWEGKEVVIVGYYRGWDLLGEANQPPPVTRSDWVVKDASGAIYVTAGDAEITGQEKLPEGENLTGGNKAATSHIVRVTGIVRLTAEKQPYIEPAKIEVMK